MPRIKRILFPVDFSNSCLGAARYVEAVAGQFEAEVILLHAVAPREQDFAGELLRTRREQLDAFLVCELKPFTARRLCVTGDPAWAIQQAAQAWDADLVMLPTHGLGYFRRHLLGSVTAKTLHDLACPVWTTIHAETAPALEDIHCRRILCAVDLGARSKCVLQWAGWLAGEYQASLDVVHATSAIDQAAAGWYLGTEFQRYVLDQTDKKIDALRRPLAGDSRVFINPGHPAKVIAAAVKDFGADLLVIGRHDATGIAGHLLQDAFAILRGSPCPVISV